jgi:hypothetical protein
LIAVTLTTVGTAMSQPSVTMRSLEAEQVYLLASSAPEFALALHPDRNKELDILLPYTPLIKNDSDKEVIAYSVRWICTDTNGKTGASEANIFNFSTLRPGSNLPPHKSRLVSLIQGLGMGHPQLTQGRGDAERTVALFQKQRSIVISLEAVVFEDGSTAGRDRNHWIPRWKAYLDAERDAYGHVSQSSPAELRTSLEKLAATAFDVARPLFQNEQRESIHLYLATRHADTYEDCYVLMRGYYAKEFLAKIEENGEESTIQSIKEFIGSKRYPTIKRKESSE